MSQVNTSALSIFSRESRLVYHFRGFKLGLTTSVVSLLSKSIKSRRAKNLRFEIDIAKSHLQKEGEDDRQLGGIQSFYLALTLLEFLSLLSCVYVILLCRLATQNRDIAGNINLIVLICRTNLRFIYSQSPIIYNEHAKQRKNPNGLNNLFAQ